MVAAHVAPAALASASDEDADLLRGLAWTPATFDFNTPGHDAVGTPFSDGVRKAEQAARAIDACGLLAAHADVTIAGAAVTSRDAANATSAAARRASAGSYRPHSRNAGPESDEGLSMAARQATNAGQQRNQAAVMAAHNAVSAVTAPCKTASPAFGAEQHGARSFHYALPGAATAGSAAGQRGKIDAPARHNAVGAAIAPCEPTAPALPAAERSAPGSSSGQAGTAAAGSAADQRAHCAADQRGEAATAAERTTAGAAIAPCRPVTPASVAAQQGARSVSSVQPGAAAVRKAEAADGLAVCAGQRGEVAAAPQPATDAAVETCKAAEPAAELQEDSDSSMKCSVSFGLNAALATDSAEVSSDADSEPRMPDQAAPADDAPGDAEGAAAPALDAAADVAASTMAACTGTEDVAALPTGVCMPACAQHSAQAAPAAVWPHESPAPEQFTGEQHRRSGPVLPEQAHVAPRDDTAPRGSRSAAGATAAAAAAEADVAPGAAHVALSGAAQGASAEPDVRAAPMRCGEGPSSAAGDAAPTCAHAIDAAAASGCDESDDALLHCQ